jgi:hypothetical protein
MGMFAGKNVRFTGKLKCLGRSGRRFPEPREIPARLMTAPPPDTVKLNEMALIKYDYLKYLK